MPNKRQRQLGCKKTAKLMAAVLALAIVLSGCSGAFSDNPVFLGIQNGESEINLNLDDIAPPEKPGEADSIQVPDENQKIFDNFIKRLKSTEGISYNRSFSHADDTLNVLNKIDEFMIADNLYTIEEGAKFAMTNLSEETRLISNGEATYNINLSSGSKEELELVGSGRRHLLHNISENTVLDLFLVEQEESKGVIHTAYHVSENNQPSKWYFDETGNLSIRIFVEEGVLSAIKYLDLRLDQEPVEYLFEVEDTTRVTVEDIKEIVEGSKTEDEEPPAEESPQPEESLQPEESPQPEETSKPVETTKQPPATVTPGSTPKPETSAPATPNPPVSSSQPPESSTPAPSTTQGGQSSTGEQGGPSVIIDYSGGTGGTTSSTPPEKPKKEESTELVNYPSNQIPLIRGFEITSVKDTVKHSVRTIEVSGTLIQNISRVADYYIETIGYATNFKDKEMYDEDTGATYYILTGKVEGWNTYIEIKEDHVTMEKTMYIRVIK